MKVNLAGARANAKMTQKEVAKRVGVSDTTMRKWENYESSPTYEQIMILCKLYNCTIDDLILSKKYA